jgi:hypothetical protein
MRPRKAEGPRAAWQPLKPPMRKNEKTVKPYRQLLWNFKRSEPNKVLLVATSNSLNPGRRKDFNFSPPGGQKDQALIQQYVAPNKSILKVPSV